MPTLRAKAYRGYSNGRAAVTLLEAIVTIAIVGTLATLTVVAVQRARDACSRAECANKLRQMALAVHQYEGVHRKLPEGCAYPFLGSPKDLTIQGGFSWQTAILPFIDFRSLGQIAWDAQRADPITHNSPLHATVRQTVVPVFLCPAEPQTAGFNSANGWRWGITSYLGVAGTDKRLNDGIFHKNYTVRFSAIADGTSNTLMIGERPAGPNGQYSAWYAGWGDCVCSLSQILHAGNGRWRPAHSGCQVSISVFRPGRLGDLCDVNHFWSLHSGGANFAFADSTVRFLTYDSASIMEALATRAGGEAVSLD
jgi:prepilin-type processing-associated H-X9-DG protein